MWRRRQAGARWQVMSNSLVHLLHFFFQSDVGEAAWFGTQSKGLGDKKTQF